MKFKIYCQRGCACLECINNFLKQIELNMSNFWTFMNDKDLSDGINFLFLQCSIVDKIMNYFLYETYYYKNVELKATSIIKMLNVY